MTGAERAVSIAIGEDEAGMRLDRWFRRRYPDLPLAHLMKIVRKGEVRVDGKRVEASARLEAGQSVRVPPLRSAAAETPAPAPNPADAEAIRAMILYEDGDVLVLNKPYGLAAQGGSGTKVIIRGKRRENVAAKDFILKLLSMEYIRSGKALAKVIEYSGEAIEALGVDERATMTNMAAEIGGFTGIVAPDQKTVEFLMERRGMSENEAQTLVEGLYSDPDAHYAHVIELDASEIYPMVATPGDPGNGKFIRELNTPVPVEIAYGGTCTAGKNEDMDMYALVLRDALKQGRRVAESCKFYLQFGSQETREYCVRKGYLDIFERAGAQVIEPSCGACINAGPGVSTRPDQVVISAQNRNFPGRSGPGQMYLASPLTVAASAIAGYIVEYEPAEEREPAQVV